MIPSSQLQSIPTEALNVIEHYKHIKAGDGKTVRCPYYRNPRSGRERWGLNAFSGKGSPAEIEQEMKIIERLEDKNFAELSEEEIRDIMRKRKLGVECSGFITHVLDAWVKKEKGKRIYQVLVFPPKRGIFGRIAAKLRPFTHIDVETLTAPQNAQEFTNYHELSAGDLIRFYTKISPESVVTENALVDHAILVTKVERDTENRILRIQYAESIHEIHGEGIKEGIITVSDAKKPLEEQEWKEVPETRTTVNIQSATPPRFYHLSFLK